VRDVFQKGCGLETYFTESLLVGIQYGPQKWPGSRAGPFELKFAKSRHDGQSCRTNCGKQPAGRPHNE
jgi:hypothetical protein